MIETLRKIVQAVSEADDLEQAGVQEIESDRQLSARRRSQHAMMDVVHTTAFALDEAYACRVRSRIHPQDPHDISPCPSLAPPSRGLGSEALELILRDIEVRVKVLHVVEVFECVGEAAQFCRRQEPLASMLLEAFDSQAGVDALSAHPPDFRLSEHNGECAKHAVCLIGRSEEHTSELQSQSRNSYAVFY